MLRIKEQVEDEDVNRNVREDFMCVMSKNDKYTKKQREMRKQCSYRRK